MARREITKDGVGFPHRGIAIPDDGNAAVRVHRQESRRIEPAKRTAGVNLLVREFEFADQPHDFLDVE